MYDSSRLNIQRIQIGIPAQVSNDCSRCTISGKDGKLEDRRFGVIPCDPTKPQRVRSLCSTLLIPFLTGSIGIAAKSDLAKTTASDPASRPKTICGENWEDTRSRMARVSRSVSCLSSERIDFCDLAMGLGVGAVALHSGKQFSQTKFRPELSRLCSLTALDSPWIESAWASEGCISRENLHRALILKSAEELKDNLQAAISEQNHEIMRMTFVNSDAAGRKEILAVALKEINEANAAQSLFLNRNNATPDPKYWDGGSRYQQIIKTDEYKKLEARRARASKVHQALKLDDIRAEYLKPSEKTQSYLDGMKKKLEEMKLAMSQVQDYIAIAQPDSGVSGSVTIFL